MHTGDAGLTAHVLATVRRCCRRSVEVQGQEADRRLIAAAMAMNAEPSGSVYDERGVLSISWED